MFDLLRTAITDNGSISKGVKNTKRSLILLIQGEKRIGGLIHTLNLVVSRKLRSMYKLLRQTSRFKCSLRILNKENSDCVPDPPPILILTSLALTGLQPFRLPLGKSQLKTEQGSSSPHSATLVIMLCSTA